MSWKRELLFTALVPEVDPHSLKPRVWKAIKDVPGRTVVKPETGDGSVENYLYVTTYRGGWWLSAQESRLFWARQIERVENGTQAWDLDDRVRTFSEVSTFREVLGVIP